MMLRITLAYLASLAITAVIASRSGYSERRRPEQTFEIEHVDRFDAAVAAAQEALKTNYETLVRLPNPQAEPVDVFVKRDLPYVAIIDAHFDTLMDKRTLFDLVVQEKLSKIRDYRLATSVPSGYLDELDNFTVRQGLTNPAVIESRSVWLVFPFNCIERIRRDAVKMRRYFKDMVRQATAKPKNEQQHKSAVKRYKTILSVLKGREKCALIRLW